MMRYVGLREVKVGRRDIRILGCYDGLEERWRNVEFKVISSSAAKSIQIPRGKKEEVIEVHTAVQPGKRQEKKGRL